MALPFLPYNEIEPMFITLSGQVQDPILKSLVEYIRRQWIESTIFLPKNWSVYQQAVRTNNDIEGWHNALNRHAGGRSNLPLYLLIEILDREAQLATINIGNFTRMVKKRPHSC